MSPTALAIQHVAFENLGELEPLLKKRGYQVNYHRAGIDPLDAEAVNQADLLVVLGGPLGVYDTEGYPFLDEEKSVIASRLDQGGPTLGICLGAQLIAAALGAPVRATGRHEIGFAPLSVPDRDSLLHPLDTVPVLHWHGDQFDIPAGATLLASTPDFPHQAFSVGPTVLGLQFHLEADYRLIEQWLTGHAHELAVNGIDPRTIREDAAAFGPELSRIAKEVMGSWLDGFSAGSTGGQ